MLDVVVGERQYLAGLTLFPLLAPEGATLPYELLVDAVAAGTLVIGEVGTGTVPTLQAKNAADRDVLVLDGEQLIGSRQNRMTNRSMVLPALSTTELPVFCMEHGRWRFESERMAPAPQHSPAKTRRRAREVEAAQAAASGQVQLEALRLAQGAVWEDVADTLSKVGARSLTGALDAAYEANRSRLEDWARAFPQREHQVGFMAFVGDEPLGLDLIGCHRLYGRLHDRLLRGYLMDALERGGDGRDVSPAAGGEAAERYLAAVREAERVAAPTAGKGTYRVLRGQVIGAELTDSGRPVHLSAFPAVRRPDRAPGPEAPPIGDPLAPPSRRRRG